MTQDDIARLADTAAKLLTETQRLHRDVTTLLVRIEPYDNEDELLGPEYSISPGEYRFKTDPTVSDAMNVIREARAIIEACERDLSAIRSRITAIAEDVHSREDFKQWLKPRPPRE